MSRSYDERCQLYFDAIRECKLLPTIINPEMNLKRQKLQSETIILLSNNVNDEDLQIRILALFWSKICYSTIANLRRCWKQLKRGSTGEVDCQNFMLALYSFFQTISTRLVSKDIFRISFSTEDSFLKVIRQNLWQLFWFCCCY